MGKIKYEIRSNVKGKLVPIYLNYQDTNSHFRIKTDFTVKQEYWNASKEIIKPIYFDENNFSIEQRNSVEQALNDLKSKVEREITLGTIKGLIINRDYVSRIKPFLHLCSIRKTGMNLSKANWYRQIIDGRYTFILTPKNRKMSFTGPAVRS